MNRQLPAGLIDHNIEFFNDPENPEIAYCLTGGKVTRVHLLPEFVKEKIREDMAKYPEKVESLVMLGYESDDHQLEKYCSCCFGAFDGNADVVNDLMIHNEFWPCPKRGCCPVEGKLCDALKVGDKGQVLTRREVDVLSLIAKGLLDKEVAARLAISEQTVKVHKSHIMEKSGLNNKQELVILAHQKNLI